MPNVNSNPFSDTQNPNCCNELGIVNGIGHGLFPNNTATREEIVVMLYRTLKAARPNSNVEMNPIYLKIKIQYQNGLLMRLSICVKPGL